MFRNLFLLHDFNFFIFFFETFYENRIQNKYENYNFDVIVKNFTNVINLLIIQ